MQKYTSIGFPGSSPLAGRRLPPSGRRDRRGGLIPARGETTRLSRGSWASRRAHPRSRGDDCSSVAGRGSSTGSSPLAGRRPAPCHAAPPGVRLIPARGETTRPGHHQQAAPRAHPRSRGDDVPGRLRPAGHAGSSPLAGRRHPVTRRGVCERGLIPARGETTPGRRARRTGCRAHPRSRGDDDGLWVLCLSDDGSSPLAGRRQPARPREVERGGLIPARGETTRRPPAHRSRSRAHPRSRGDDELPLSEADYAQGSSPLAGRRPRAARRAPQPQRLIPARGETTGDPQPRREATWAHPRSRGDDHSVLRLGALTSGSSPLAGRRRDRAGRLVERIRLIPARGETTPTSCCRIASTPAHPRSRGDDRDAAVTPRDDDGSSPLAGRRHLEAHEVGQPGGLIPARGETTTERAVRTPPPRAHPRSRGDDSATNARETRLSGSSPLAGRRLGEPAPTRRHRRLIPARGETTRARRRWRSR